MDKAGQGLPQVHSLLSGKVLSASLEVLRPLPSGTAPLHPVEPRAQHILLSWKILLSIFFSRTAYGWGLQAGLGPSARL